MGFRAIYPGSSGADRSQFVVGDDQRPYLLTRSGVLIPLSVGEDATAALHTGASFESFTGSVPDGWDPFWNLGGSTAPESDDVLFGDFAVTVDSTAGGGHFQLLLGDNFAVAGGETVEVGVWGHKIAGNPKVSLGILTGRSGSPNFFTAGFDVVESAAVDLAADYTRYVNTFPIPAGHVVCRLFIRSQPTAAEATSARYDLSTSRRFGVASVAGAGYRGTGSAQTIAHNTPTTVDLSGTADFDNGGVSIASNIVTITNSGTYRLNSNVQFGGGAAGRRRASIETWTGSDPGVGLATQVAYAESYADTTANSAFSPSTVVNLAAGAKVRLVAFVTTTTTGSVDLGNAFGYPPQLIINKA